MERKTKTLLNFYSSSHTEWLSPKWLFTFTKYLLTTVVLNPKHKVATWVTDCFHGDAREFGHWGLGKQLPCYLE